MANTLSSIAAPVAIDPVAIDPAAFTSPRLRGYCDGMNKSAKTMLDTNLEGQLLIAMPGMSDRRFARAVVCICAHSDDGAMGLIVNKPAGTLTFAELIDQIDVFDQPEGFALPVELATKPILTGGPVERRRGFILHSGDYLADGATVRVADGICLTATTDILKAIAEGNGPDQSILALGYAGWAPGQLESELSANGWLHCPADADLVFAHDYTEKYAKALAKLGVDPSHLVATAGRA